MLVRRVSRGDGGSPVLAPELLCSFPCPAERGLARSDGAIRFGWTSPSMTTDLNTTAWYSPVHLLFRGAFLLASNAFRTPSGVVPVHAADTRSVSGSLSSCYVTRITFRLRLAPRGWLRIVFGGPRERGKSTREKPAVRRSDRCAAHESAGGRRDGRPRGPPVTPSSPDGLRRLRSSARPSR